MSHRLAILSVCLLALRLADAAPPAKAAEPPVSLLAATVGDTLVFQETRPTDDGGTTRLITTTVVEATRVGEALMVAVREEKEGAVPEVTIYQQTDAGLFLMTRDRQALSAPCCVARLPLRAGDTWEVNNPAVFPVAIKYTTGTEEEVEVPAGKFKAVRVESRSVLQDGKLTRATAWVAPGLGTVKTRVRLYNGTEITLSLKSFTPAKK